ncbi:MAG: Crp/Fnr family transcriptional regulator [Acidocella sp.]|nr:Crp/Fnr family transcriptional regulator [Acidocella sp.]
MIESQIERPRNAPDRPGSQWSGILAGIQMFSGLGPNGINKLLDCSHERRMQRGEFLMRAGAPADSMMVIMHGEVRVMLSSPSGQGQIINAMGAGAVFGEIGLFDGKPRTADVVAVTNGRLLTIDGFALQSLLARDPQFAMGVIRIICGRLRNTLGQLESMIFQDVATRLASSLLELAQGSPPRRLDMTQAALGQLVGASREVVNKRLRALETAGIVSLSPGRVILIDEIRLAEMIPGSLSRMRS